VKIVVDMNLSPEWVPALRLAGFEATWVVSMEHDSAKLGRVCTGSLGPAFFDFAIFDNCEYL